MNDTIKIYKNGVLIGIGTIDSDGEIICDAVLGPDQDASSKTYEAIMDAIDSEPQDADRYTGSGSVIRPDGEYSWQIESGAPAQNLDDLLTEIRAGRQLLHDSLPTFGGAEPLDTTQVWSWDENRLLVGTCVSDLGIVPREEW